MPLATRHGSIMAKAHSTKYMAVVEYNVNLIPTLMRKYIGLRRQQRDNGLVMDAEMVWKRYTGFDHTEIPEDREVRIEETKPP
ncbi:hypothetical protein Tco_0627793 [Tanacetum coccineum]|uniref:Uncharacterized protein n=1 Tax=Tanacetum coccineum TaxID=301880 RepID=A0ABQ4WNF8_9ASTR